MSIKKTHILFFLATTIFFIGCSKKDSIIDEEKPTINLAYKGGFPKTSCTSLTKEQTYTFSVRVSDNLELANYSIDIHNNFDHHTHDDQGAKCILDPPKIPVKPLIYMQNKPIEGGLKEYEIKHEITIPNQVDTGDYHCEISVTDITGWQSRTSVDIKITE